MTTLALSVQQIINNLQLNTGLVDLYTLDAANIGGSTYRFTTEQTPGGGSPVFNGVSYTPLPIVAQGFEVRGSGTLPQPTLTVSNVTGTIQSAVDSLGGLVGAKLTRIRTFTRFLDAATFSTRWNLLNHSESINNAAWLKVRADTQTDVVRAPDNTWTGDKLRETGTTAPASPYFYATQTVSAGANTTFTLSAWFRAAERTFANLRFDDGAGVNTCTVSINLSTGAVGTIARAGNTSNASASAENAGEGWWRLKLTCTWAAITDVRVFVRPAISLDTGAAGLGYIPTATQGIFVWGVSLVAGTDNDPQRPYQPTGSGLQPYADTGAFIGPETWTLAQKTLHNRELIQWRLATSLDRASFRFGRQILPDTGVRNLYAPGVGRTRVR